jgi:hypothetical protein
VWWHMAGLELNDLLLEMLPVEVRADLGLFDH